MRPLLVAFLILIDQTAKYLIRSQGGFYVCNPNIALGIKVPEILFWFFWIFAILIISYLIFNFQFSIFNQFSIAKFSNFKIFGLMLILSGAISNAIDRIIFNCITDFINLGFGPIFNFADTFITIGVIILIIGSFKKFDH